MTSAQPGPAPSAGPSGPPGAAWRPVPAPVPPAAPSTSLRGPVALTVSGAVLLVVATVVAVLVSRTFVGLLPTDLLTRDGGPGEAVVGMVDAPGTATATLAAGTRYVVLMAEPTERTGSGDDADLGELGGDLQVTTPDGRTLAADLSPGVNLTSSAGGTTVHSVGAFRTDRAGEHTLVAPPAVGGADEVRVMIAPDQPFLPFFTGIFGSVFGVFVVIGTTLLGVPMLVVGIVWWRRRAAARAAARPSGSPA